MTNICVTGAAGYLGQRVLKQLIADSRVEKIIGIDVRDPQISSSKFKFHRASVLDPEISSVLAREQISSIAHLAFFLQPTHFTRAQQVINVEGSRRIFQAAQDAEIRKIIFSSSSVVYG